MKLAGGYCVICAGFQMLEAQDGKQGIAAAEAQRPDLILMDVQLPLVEVMKRPDAPRLIRSFEQFRLSS